MKITSKTGLTMVLAYVMVFVPALAAGPARLTLHAGEPKETIAPEIYGHFAEHLGRCIYDGIWVGEDSPIPNIGGVRTDVLDALKALNIPVLRWPGGCFADEYHWKEGIGPRHKRPSMVNTHWGMVTETNAFGTILICHMGVRFIADICNYFYGFTVDCYCWLKCG